MIMKTNIYIYRYMIYIDNLLLFILNIHIHRMVICGNGIDMGCIKTKLFIHLIYTILVVSSVMTSPQNGMIKQNSWFNG